MFEHNGITYYSENEFKKEIEEHQKEHKRRLKIYNTIRLWILIVLVISLAGNLHLYLNYNNALELLYVCNAKQVLTSIEEQIDKDTDISEEEKIIKKEEIKKEQEEILKREDKAMHDKYASEVVGDVMKKSKTHNYVENLNEEEN